MKQEKQEIVIVGAGIIGVCTAYYLTQHPDFDSTRHHITILEARRPAGGASGKAGGLLALWAFPQQIVPLSFKLHQELSDLYNGEKEWGYRRLDTLSIEGNLTTKKKPTGETFTPDLPTRYSRKPINAGEPLPEEVDWIRPEIIENWSSIGSPETTAQVHPYKITTFLLKKVLETGAAELVIGKVVNLRKDEDGTVIGVSYEKQSRERNTAESTQDANAVNDVTGTANKTNTSNGVAANGSDLTTVDLEADKVVLTMGPWTSKLLPTCPISGLRAHSITIKPNRQVSAHAMFTELKVKRGQYVSPEIYPRKDEVYVCGEGDTLVPTPESTDDVEVNTGRCEDLFKYAGEISDVLRSGRILRRQACYLPVTDIASCSGPLIGHTNVRNLYLASGHSCWGINNAPATGKIMAEIILEGKASSANVTGLEPELFFDATSIN
ncbi:Tda3p [Sugiyamaella lignohabitans]|uniref:Tda3p n=1 Tax=Sugiyamaella lignohabitans TaxID=796027 RepID=A0A167C8W3_9ASCO|nr:Tda3p [Sugiyamaella lignohabitans]ANB11370.1 Tda3p [Sugiyamaella lignohabitans]